ncbi:hypothetical protein PRZ48_009382 [Zasmidium cellare]|uniref:Uncharacterized protein n=1 Tax=Zasmidium cellare TaxID=395010 RepID=A0ABR0EBL3_ZASCE|nr:hypothetical protein PRZ48_009382 [Zasmidium cellare]
MTPLTILLFLPLVTLAQNCYFPSGALAPDSSPCSPTNSTSLCCPLNWECLSNGLCYLDAEDYYGRYSCTDQEWGEGCPGWCTSGTGRGGNEAVLQCSDGHWCCDGNRSGNCCEEDDAEVIDVPDGKPVAFISQAPSPSSVVGTTRSASSASSSSTSSSGSSRGSSTSTTQTSTPSPTTITTQSATTNSAGIATTILIISTATQSLPPPPTTDAEDQPSSAEPSKSNTPLIAGLAAGLPTAALLLSGLIFLLYRRRKRNPDNEPKSSYSTSTTDPSDLKPMYTNTTPDGRPPEIDSYPIAATTTTRNGKRMSLVSELSGSEPERSPTVSSLNSPMSKSAAGFGGGLSQVREEESGPVELPGSEPNIQTQDFANKRTSYPGYVPYQQGGEVESERRQSMPPNPPPPNAGAYVPYRPPGGEGESTVSGGQGEGERVEQAQSPRTDFDHGQLGPSGLRIVNQ